MVDVCFQRKNQRYQNHSSVRDNIEHNSNNNNNNTKALGTSSKHLIKSSLIRPKKTVNVECVEKLKKVQIMCSSNTAS